MFERALGWRKESGGTSAEVRVARWCVARAQRSLGRARQALETQRALQLELEREGAGDGYVLEELGECLLALGRTQEARPWFARAWEALSRDPWLAENEAGRLARLKELGAGAG